MKTNPPEGTSSSPEMELLNDNTPTQILVTDRTSNLLHYFKNNGPYSKLHAVPASGDPVYEIFLESGSIFLKAGSYAFQLTARPQKAWQRDLRLTTGSLEILNNFEKETEQKRTANKKPIEAIRRELFESFRRTSEASTAPVEPIKPKEEPIDPYILRFMQRLADELKRNRFTRRIKTYNPSSTERNTHIILFQDNNRAGTYINIIVQRLNSNRPRDKKFFKRGGEWEKIILKLSEILNCKGDLEAVLRAARPDAEIKLKHYSNGSEIYNFPDHTGTILIEEKK